MGLSCALETCLRTNARPTSLQAGCHHGRRWSASHPQLYQVFLNRPHTCWRSSRYPWNVSDLDRAVRRMAENYASVDTQNSVFCLVDEARSERGKRETAISRTAKALPHTAKKTWMSRMTCAINSCRRPVFLSLSVQRYHLSRTRIWLIRPSPSNVP